jgi:hypothetical protein
MSPTRQDLAIGKVELYPPTQAREWPEKITLPVTSDGSLEARLNQIDRLLYDLTEKLDALMVALRGGAVGKWS